MNYIHIFTDGLDKLLSASIWFKWYGGTDSFCFYKDNSLKGYISEDEFKRLKLEGKKLLQDEKFIKKLFSESKNLESQVLEFKKKQDKSRADLKSLSEISKLLEDCYKRYFYTEEYYTDNLNPTSNKELIEQIGKFRFSFIKICILATESVQNLANKLVGDKRAEFLMINEILDGKNPNSIGDREKAFLLIQKDHKLTLHTNSEAENQYKIIFHEMSRNKKDILGVGVSQGKVKGLVYKISLTSKNQSDQIDNILSNSVLVTESTQPKMLLACKKASAIVTNEGGILSHAAILSRELGIPCVVGTRNAVDILNNGDLVEVDANKGVVRVLERTK